MLRINWVTVSVIAHALVILAAAGIAYTSSGVLPPWMG